MKKLLLLLFLAGLISCDIPGILRLENASSGDALYITYQEDENGEVEKIELEIASKEKREIAFGFGQSWTDQRISEYLSDVKKVEIITQNDTLIMSDKGELFQFFKKRRKGLFKNIMKVKIE